MSLASLAPAGRGPGRGGPPRVSLARARPRGLGTWPRFGALAGDPAPAAGRSPIPCRKGGFVRAAPTSTGSSSSPTNAGNRVCSPTKTGNPRRRPHKREPRFVRPRGPGTPAAAILPSVSLASRPTRARVPKTRPGERESRFAWPAADLAYASASPGFASRSPWVACRSAVARRASPVSLAHAGPGPETRPRERESRFACPLTPGTRPQPSRSQRVSLRLPAHAGDPAAAVSPTACLASIAHAGKEFWP
ncbi:hypothetical protein HNR73_001216 [Phytomonospora endophytica]|uniref:Uncharacterized protein n=1 Tax=Phytomonospora endophytica TaxID=714109 RepID=A0A841FL59_9ACTN|nr:hypothetical protein [Phytomonospora endophytica]